MNNSSIPDPVADDTTYFQVLIDDQLASAADVIHLTYTGNRMKLDSPDIYNISWLTGGGANFDDWDNPVMQVVNDTSGVSGGAQFADTYDITLDVLPKDPSGKYRVLKIPYLDPSDSTYSLAGSGHLTVTINAAAVMQINTSGQAGGYAFALPSPAPAGAGGQTKWDFVEFNCATPSVNSKSVCFVDTTNVDMYALGFTIKGRQADGSLSTFGIDLNSTNPVTSLLGKLEALPADYTAGLTKDGAGHFLRYRAPDLSFTSSTTVLDSAIDAGYAQYKSAPLKFQVGAVSYEATTNSSDELVFTKPKAFSIGKPTTLEVIASTGPLDTGTTGDADIQGAMKFIDAALNRGIFGDASTWLTPSKWYPSGVAYNEYSKCLHDAFIDSACYGFSYDDVPGNGVTSAPTIGTCTSMTLVVTDQ